MTGSLPHPVVEGPAVGTADDVGWKQLVRLR